MAAFAVISGSTFKILSQAATTDEGSQLDHNWNLLDAQFDTNGSFVGPTAAVATFREKNRLYVALNDTPTNNAAKVAAVYAWAKANLSPSDANQVTIVVGPGYIDVGTGFLVTMNTHGVRIVFDLQTYVTGGGTNGILAYTTADSVVSLTGLITGDGSHTVTINATGLGWVNGMFVMVSGASSGAANGTFRITLTGTSATYTTGFIVANGTITGASARQIALRAGIVGGNWTNTSSVSRAAFLNIPAALGGWQFSPTTLAMPNCATPWFFKVTTTLGGSSTGIGPGTVSGIITTLALPGNTDFYGTTVKNNTFGPASFNSNIIFASDTVVVNNDCGAGSYNGFIEGTGSVLGTVYGNTINGKRIVDQSPTTNQFTAYGAGTAYTLTVTPALVNLGTTQPSVLLQDVVNGDVVLSGKGQFRISGSAVVQLNGATITGQTVTLVAYVSSAVAGDDTTPAPRAVASATVTIPTGTHTTESSLLAQLSLPVTFYSPIVGDKTLSGDDPITIQLWASISGLPSVGSVQITQANLIVEQVP